MDEDHHGRLDARSALSFWSSSWVCGIVCRERTPIVIYESGTVADTEVMGASDQRLLESFRNYLRVEKGLAALTVASYESDLTQFAEFLHGRRRELLAARREDVRGFLSQLFGNGVSDRSV